VRTVLLDRVDVPRRDELDRLAPARAHESALAARLLVAAPRIGVLRHLAEREHRVARALARLAVRLQERAPHVRVAHARGGVRVPGERSPAGTPTGLVLGTIGSDARVIRLLRLPRDDPVFHVDLPRTGSRAVHAVRRTDDLVVTPS